MPSGSATLTVVKGTPRRLRSASALRQSSPQSYVYSVTGYFSDASCEASGISLVSMTFAVMRFG